jgi:hypothetical protein
MAGEWMYIYTTQVPCLLNINWICLDGLMLNAKLISPYIFAKVFEFRQKRLAEFSRHYQLAFLSGWTSAKP